MYRLFCSILLILIFGKTSGQNQAAKDTSGKESVVKSVLKIKPKIRVGLDVSRLFLSFSKKGYRAGEGSVDFNINKSIYGIHLGYAERNFSLPNFDALSSGIYVSTGVCRNIFNESDNILAFGGRMAGSFYRYQPEKIQLTNPFNGEITLLDRPNENGRMLWFEFVSTMRAKVWGWMMLGFELRVKYRLLNQFKGDEPYFYPGFGLGENRLNLGFNYFIFINLPTKK